MKTPRYVKGLKNGNSTIYEVKISLESSRRDYSNGACLPRSVCKGKG
jgi:hypothetical protein